MSMVYLVVIIIEFSYETSYTTVNDHASERTPDATDGAQGFVGFT